MSVLGAPQRLLIACNCETGHVAVLGHRLAAAWAGRTLALLEPAERAARQEASSLIALTSVCAHRSERPAALPTGPGCEHTDFRSSPARPPPRTPLPHCWRYLAMAGAQTPSASRYELKELIGKGSFGTVHRG